MITKKLLLASFVVLLFSGVSHAQVGIGINTPEPSAQLDVSSTERGFLPPRMTSAQRNLIASPATGLLIFQTDNSAGYYYYNGTAWVALGGNSVSNGTTIGQMNYWNGSAWFSLPPGTDGQVLTIAQGVPTWSAAPSLNAGLTPNVNTNTVNYDYNSYIFSLNGVLLPGPTNTDHGFVWSTNPNPTIQNSFLTLGVGTIGSNFTGQVDISQFITPNTTYYFRAYAANNYGVGYGNVLTFTTGPFLINQSYQGGKIAFIDGTGIHGVIMSVILGQVPYGCRGVNIGATNNTIGGGANNTQAINNSCFETSFAAKLCLQYNGGGYNDWYLPNQNEFFQLYGNRFTLGLAQEGWQYWSSLEINSLKARIVRLNPTQTDFQDMDKNSNGDIYYNPNFRVRAFRNF